MRTLIEAIKITIKFITHAHLCCKATMELVELFTEEELSEITEF